MLNYYFNRNSVLLGKRKVPRVMCWNSHNGTSAVAGQDIVGHPELNPVPIEWADRIASGENAVLVTSDRGPLNIRPGHSHTLVFFDLFLVLGIHREPIKQGRFR
jgi:hypothetical protein